MKKQQWFDSLTLLIAVSTCAMVQAQAPRQHGVNKGTAQMAAAARQSQQKGIFEPINYGQDINLTDVFFTSVDEGWVSGEHATILHTADGGKTWTAQVGGDPNGTEKPIGQLRFLDARHGWAVTGDERLLRTMDGENWMQIGQQPEPGSGFVDYGFTSVRHGIALGGNMGGFYVTNDGGRHWRNVAHCKLTANVQGLTRTEDCRVNRLQMLSAQQGYAMVDWSQGIAFMRTDDGGEHWSAIVPNVSDCCQPEFFLSDLNHGVLLYNNGKTYLTSDGAKTWHGLLSGSVGLTSGGQTPPLRFADPEVAWVLGASPDNSDTQRISFSTDGGQHWKMSRNLAFPSGRTELKFSLPRRDRAYIIGPHGMIYRYRIVPGGYSAAKTLDAPMMPAFGGAELSAKADAIRREIELLRAKLPASLGQAGMASSSSASPRTGGFTQQVDTGSTSASSGFTQQTDTGSSPAGDTTGAFPQDSTPVSPVLADCCSAALQTLQTDTSAFAQQAPAVGSQFKSLNLIVAGAQWVVNLNNQAHSVWSSFLALKHAANPQVASAALQQFSTGVNTAQQTGSTGAQNQGSWFATNAPADFTQDVSPGTSVSP